MTNGVRSILTLQIWGLDNINTAVIVSVGNLLLSAASDLLA